MLSACIMLFGASGCVTATSFTGSAHIEDGRAGCERKCAGQGLAMTGIVYMGEYSSACVCEVPGATTSGAASASGGAATGVVLQMRRAQEEEAQRNSYLTSLPR